MPGNRTLSPGRRLLRYAWQTPLFALLFAVFFGTVMGASLPAYVVAYELSLIFSAVIFLGFWVLESFVLPRLAALEWWRPSVFGLAAAYSTVSVASSFVAVFVIRAFVRPDFLGDARQLAAWGMYMLLFLLLANAIAVALAYHKGAIEHARRDKELELARRIQHSFLPEAFPADTHVDVHALNVPSRGVSGDFYDVVAADKALVLAVADVEGKSVPAALLTSMLQASLRTQTSSVASTAVLLGNVNALACRRSSSIQQFATFFLARVTEDARLTYTNGGHNPPLLLRAGGATAPGAGRRDARGHGRGALRRGNARALLGRPAAHLHGRDHRAHEPPRGGVRGGEAGRPLCAPCRRA